MFKKKQSFKVDFEVGDKVDVHPQYQQENPERDCSGQAVIEQITHMFGKTVYGVSFPNMQEGFKFYWINGGYLRHSQKEQSV